MLPWFPYFYSDCPLPYCATIQRVGLDLIITKFSSRIFQKNSVLFWNLHNKRVYLKKAVYCDVDFQYFWRRNFKIITVRELFWRICLFQTSKKNWESTRKNMAFFKQKAFRLNKNCLRMDKGVSYKPSGKLIVAPIFLLLELESAKEWVAQTQKWVTSFCHLLPILCFLLDERFCDKKESNFSLHC